MLCSQSHTPLRKLVSACPSHPMCAAHVSPANYTGQSGMPWWTLTVLVMISFIFCTLYGMLAATIGFYEFNSSGTGFFQMITCMSLPCLCPTRRR